MPTCRICGASCSPAELRDGLTDKGGCVNCDGSPRCADCRHTRDQHAGTYGTGPSRCKARSFDFQSLTAAPCLCTGYVAA